MKIINKKSDELTPYINNSRTHSDKQIDQVAASIKEFGFLNPVIIDEEGGIIAGHCRYMAAKKLGLDKIPCVDARHLTSAQKKAYVIADNKLALNAGWDEELLKIEIEGLQDDGFDVSVLGFDDVSFDDDAVDKNDASIKSGFEVIVECGDEQQQRNVFEKLTREGFVCRLFTL